MNFNRIMLGGNITRDPALSYTTNQTACCEFGMAINKKYKDKESVCFVDIVAFGKTGENINKYLKKGDPIFVEGELQFQSWEAKDGSRRSKHKVIVQSFQFLGDGQKKEKQPQTTNEPDDDPEIPF